MPKIAGKQGSTGRTPIRGCDDRSCKTQPFWSSSSCTSANSDARQHDRERGSSWGMDGLEASGGGRDSKAFRREGMEWMKRREWAEAA